jgi:L,D-peptidoglycan transpeptidase YkuD (ErfK/YbiS/YcfS/YnhG family)
VTLVRVDTSARTIHFDDRSWPCAIGRSGACPAERKREGDGCTPLGRWPVRTVLLRPDRWRQPPAGLPWRWIRPQDGWSDAPSDPVYNRPVRHPHPASAEWLWRDDAVYDAILVLGHNDAPPVPGAGSAIFLHLRGDKPTEGCVAIDRSVMAALLAWAPAGTILDFGSALR